MNKPTGFLEHSRQEPDKLEVSKRVKNYHEFVQKYNPKILNEQAARCMNCGVPFCHSGCPLGNVIPEFNEAVYNEEWQKAYQILIATNNFPEFTGRICPAPCEHACVLGINQPPVTIEEIEKHIIEVAFENNFVQPKFSTVKTGFKIAVVGSGPAGLAVADQLSSVGHVVTVFERHEQPGGLLRFGIPDFKLEKTVVERRIKLMEKAGVIFKCNTEVGMDYSIEQLIDDFDAIILAGGSTVPRNLNVEGRHLKGVHFAMDFLSQQNKRMSGVPIKDIPILATYKNVVVIGGGDTGSDCIGTSNRQGAKSVTQFELLPMPPKQRTATMPWPQYAPLLKTTSSHEEGVERIFSIQTKAFMGDVNQNLVGIQTVQIEWIKDEHGKMIPKEIPNTEKTYPCELALLAMGFLHPQYHGLLENLAIDRDLSGNVNAHPKTFKTNKEKFFCCGDMRRGQSLVVWAISEGRECALKVDEFLQGTSSLSSKDGY
ncbi:MAG: glutamate synthase subunit beta [Alphaproteobacteria bacterium]|nr:glutamate synthase subunit beta [Alphaproteobacteria bacterium]